MVLCDPDWYNKVQSLLIVYVWYMHMYLNVVCSFNLLKSMVFFEVLYIVVSLSCLFERIQKSWFKLFCVKNYSRTWKPLIWFQWLNVAVYIIIFFYLTHWRQYQKQMSKPFFCFLIRVVNKFFAYMYMYFHF